MIGGYIGLQIRRTNRNLLWTSIIFAAIVIGISLLTSGYLRECLTGPTPADLKDITKLSSPSQAPHKFVRVKIDSGLLDRHFYHVTGGKDHKNDYYHFLHVAPGRIMVVKSHSEDLPHEVEASIDSTSSYVQSNVLSGVRGNVSGTALDVMLDLSSYRAGMYVLLFVGGPVLLLAGWNVLRAVRRMGDESRHPLFRQLTTYGEPETVAAMIDVEHAAGAQQTGKVLTTTSWLMCPNAYNLALVYLGDVVWAYKQETKHKSYGITTNRTYSTVINENNGKSREFMMKEQQVNSLLGDLAARVPWAIVGFTPQLQAAWKKNRNEVIAAVEAKKKELMEPQEGAAPSTPSA